MIEDYFKETFTILAEASTEQVDTDFDHWTTGSTFLGSFNFMSTEDRFKDGKEVTQQRYKIKCPYDTAVTLENRLRYDGNDYRILKVSNPFLFNKFLSLEVEEVID